MSKVNNPKVNNLEVKQLSLSFSGFQALKNIDLKVEKGSLHALIGPNGAGKTSLFNCLSGLYRPQSGQALLWGKSLLGERPDHICQLGLMRSFQQPRLFSKLSLLNNLRRAYLGCHRGYFQLFFPPRYPDQKLLAILDQVGMVDLADKAAGTLAHGQQKQLDLALCLVQRPQMLLLDEPTAGMSAKETEQTVNLIRYIAQQYDLTLLFSEHDMQVVFELADTITVLQSGQVIACGTPDFVRNHSTVQQAYLGDADA